MERRAKNDAHVTAQRAVATSFFSHVPVKKGWTFDGSVATDGVSVSQQFSRREQVPRAGKKKPLVTKKYDRNLETYVAALNMLVLGVDPGRSNMAAITYLWNGRKRSWSLTRSAYYQRSGI